MRCLSTLVLAFVLLVVPGTVFAANDSDQGAAQALFEERCSPCHNLERALRKSKDRAGWNKTVLRMQRYGSGMISDDDVTVIVDHLSRIRGPAQ